MINRNTFNTPLKFRAVDCEECKLNKAATSELGVEGREAVRIKVQCRSYLQKLELNMKTNFCGKVSA